MPDGGVFRHNPVLYGGAESLRTLTMVHPHGEALPGSRRLGEHGALWTGGYLGDAAQLVRTCAE